MSCEGLVFLTWLYEIAAKVTVFEKQDDFSLVKENVKDVLMFFVCMFNFNLKSISVRF